MAMSGYQASWLGLFLYFCAVEGWALWRNRKDRDKSRTLTANVLDKFRLTTGGWNPLKNPIRYIIVTIAGWLLFHFFYQY